MLSKGQRYALLMSQALGFRMLVSCPERGDLNRAAASVFENFSPSDPLAELLRSIGENWRDICWDADALRERGDTVLMQVEMACRPPVFHHMMDR